MPKLISTPLFCALDTTNVAQARALAKQLAPTAIGLKIGLELYLANGKAGIASISEAAPDSPLFLDLKLHDIPNTVASAIKALSDLDIAYINVHAAGGEEMMRTAREAIETFTVTPQLLAVTVLTSLDDANLDKVGQKGPVADQVVRLAQLTKDCGLDGVVCSGHEITTLRQHIGNDFTLMVPGIRPANSATGDQKRVMTPEQAMAAGASHLVIGRPITQANDPAAAALEILRSIEF